MTAVSYDGPEASYDGGVRDNDQCRALIGDTHSGACSYPHLRFTLYGSAILTGPRAPGPSRLSTQEAHGLIPGYSGTPDRRHD